MVSGSLLSQAARFVGKHSCSIWGEFFVLDYSIFGYAWDLSQWKLSPEKVVSGVMERDAARR
jgi:hypothetical protein